MIWGPGALGNAVYSGCRLRDVLATVGVTTKIKNLSKLHVAFESVEQVSATQTKLTQHND